MTARRRERLDRGIKVRSEDIYALNSWRELLYLIAPRAVPVAALALLGMVVSPYWGRVLISAAMFSLLAVSWDVLASTGMVSLGQAFFFGMGAYVAGGLNHYLGWSPWVTIPLGALVGGGICTLMLLPVLRLRGIYFAMVTLILPLTIERIIEATKILGGTEGLSGLDQLPGSAVELTVAMLAPVGGPVRLPQAHGLGLRAGPPRHRRQRPGGHVGRDQHPPPQGRGPVSGRVHGRVRRGLHDPRLHVRGHAGLRPGLLHPVHRRGGRGRAGDPGRSHPGGLYPDSPVRVPCGGWAPFGS